MELAALLAEYGIAPVRIDFRGCGEPAEPGRIHPHEDWISGAMINQMK